MFEDSIFASGVSRASVAGRWTMAGSAAVQIAIAAALVSLPLVHPERLVFHVAAPLVFTPPPRPPLPVKTAQATGTTVVSNLIPSSAEQAKTSLGLSLPGKDTLQMPGPVIAGINMGSALPSVISSSAGSSTPVSVAPRQPKMLRVSDGVLAGMLITPIRPVYPAIARAAGVSGTVVVEAVIAKSGAIESLRVVSGPELLRQAALDAIRAARYQPYRLNEEPTEVQTTITVNFRMNG
jgi:periplasmic protein TonB